MINSNLVRKVSEGTTFLSPTDLFVEVDTTNGQAIIYLPSSQSIQDAFERQGNPQSQVDIRISDTSGKADVNSITIYSLDGTISGNTFVEITKQYGSIMFTITDKDIWYSGIDAQALSAFIELQDIEGISWDITKNPKAYINTNTDGRLVNLTNIQNGDVSILKSNKRLNFNRPIYKTFDNILSSGIASKEFNVGTGFNNTVYTSCTDALNKIYIGGHFTDYNGNNYNYIIKLNPDGTIDTTFNIGLGFNGGVTSLDVQADGRILVVGGGFSFYNGTPISGYIVRLNPDGTIDTSFNTGIGLNDVPRKIKQLPNGKILVAGDFTSYNSTPCNYLVMLNNDGTVDTSFNTGTGFSAPTTYFDINSDGKILVAGKFTSYNLTIAQRIILLNQDGTVDTTFNSGSGFTGGDTYVCVFNQGNKILVSGYFSSYNGKNYPYFIGLNIDGSIDNDFNCGIDVANLNAPVTDIKILDNGNILIYGYFTQYHQNQHYCIAMLNSSGNIIQTFNTTGFNQVAYTASILQDDTIIVGGQFQSYNGKPYNFIVGIYNKTPKQYLYEITNNGLQTLIRETFIYNK